MIADLELDCRGMLCPAPVIAAARAYRELRVGGVIAVAADDTAAEVDIPAWCRLTGAEYAGRTEAEDQVPVFWVRRRA